MLWSKHAEEFKLSEKSVVIIKGGKITEYNHQKGISVVSATSVIENFGKFNYIEEVKL